MFILAQVFGAGALIFEILTFQFKTKRRILLAQIAANSLWLVCDFLLFAFTGVAMLILALVRVIVFYVLEKSSRKKRLFAFGVLLVAAVAIMILTWQNWFSILAFGGWLFMTFALFQKREQNARKFGVAQGLFWTFYDLSILSIFGVIANAASLISASLALWRFRKKRRKSSRD